MVPEPKGYHSLRAKLGLSAVVYSSTLIGPCCYHMVVFAVNKVCY